MQNSNIYTWLRKSTICFADVVAVILFLLIGISISSYILTLCGIDISMPSPCEDLEEEINGLLFHGKQMCIYYLCTMLSGIVLILVYLRIRYKQTIRIANFSSKGYNPNILVMGFLWLISAVIVVEPLASLLPDTTNDIGRGFCAAISAIIVAPIIEEFLCRGIILGIFRKQFGKLTSVIGSSIIFGLLHGLNSSFVIAVVAGLVFGTIYIRTHSLHSTIILHAINNAIAFNLLSYGYSGTTLREVVTNNTTYYTIYSISILLLVLIFLEAWRKVYLRKDL